MTIKPQHVEVPRSITQLLIDRTGECVLLCQCGRPR